MHRIFIGLFIALLLLGAGITDAPAQSTNDPMVCLKTCIDTYGSDKKQSCALKCGYGSGNTGGAQNRDCGTIYKNCMRSCGSDNTCKNSCRKQRTSCI